MQHARVCSYTDFMKCQPLNFKGTEGVVRLSQWVKKMESVFHISGCAVENQVKFATYTLLGAALTWWNGHVRTLGYDAAYAMTWEILKNKLTNKYCPTVMNSHCQKKFPLLEEVPAARVILPLLTFSLVPPPIGQLYISPKKDLSWTSLPECADDTVTDYSRPLPTVESTSGDDQNRNSSASENRESTDSILSKPPVKFVKAAERPTTDKVKTAKKPAVRYAELYRRTTKKPNRLLSVLIILEDPDLSFQQVVSELVDKYISGLPDNIHGNVISARPKTLNDAIELANDLMDQKLRTCAER
nr:reverse transcriptase domain-containing protein [Tanacetum cinerariifolium]